MNWAPEVALQAEIDYRVERAVGYRDGTRREHVRAVRETHRSWWQRRNHHESSKSTGGPKAA